VARGRTGEASLPYTGCQRTAGKEIERLEVGAADLRRREYNLLQVDENGVAILHGHVAGVDADLDLPRIGWDGESGPELTNKDRVDRELALCHGTSARINNRLRANACQ
jgi:hypothetical protein